MWRYRWLVLLLVVFSWSGGPVLAADSARVSAELRERVLAGEWVEALVLLDDRAERAVQAEVERAKPAPRLMRRGDYADHLRRRSNLLDSAKREAREGLLEDDLESLTRFPVLPVMHVGIKSVRALERLAGHPRVRSVDSVDRRRHALGSSLALIRQPAVEAAGHAGAGTTVCVVDTGADYTHPAFGACVAPGGDCRVVHAQDFTASDDGARDDDGHGTNVAAIVLGVAPETRIAALDVFGPDGYAWDSEIIAAIDWCVTHRANHNIAAINLSLGSGRYFSPQPTTDSLGAAIQEAVAAGIVVAAAAGNDGYVNSLQKPAAYQGVVSVGAVYDGDIGSRSWGSLCTDASTGADRVACFSNSAGFLRILSPGVSVAAGGLTMSGTSQATPHVAGAAAVLRALYPLDSAADLVARLTASPAPLVIDPRNGVGVRRLDLPAAVGTPPPSGTVGFAAAAVEVSEGVGSVTLSVLRSGGSSGAVGVSYAAADGSALSGSDYVATAGNLTWADGDGGARTIVVPILDDAQFEAGETFSVHLSAPSGGALAGIGTATVRIRDDDPDGFPAGSGLPVGWTTPGGTSAPWTVATDSAYSGGSSLKSGAIGDDAISALAYSGNFVAGNVVFARRVSSEADFDFLRFYVDGVVRGEWSGNVDWSEVSFPVSAGAHELRWQYEKDIFVAAGADAAWIDAVILPVAVANPGVLRFTADSRSVDELAGSVQLRVLREGGSDGPASVSYASRDGSAIAGNDYTAVSGSLAWAAGEGGEKSFSVPLLRSPLPEPPETFFVDLSNAGGASLAAPQTAAVTIHETARNDFGGDGRSDVLLRHANGSTYMWMMNGTAVTAKPLVGSDPNSVVIMTGDFNADGRVDLLWRNATTGRVTMRLMDGATVLSEKQIGGSLDWRVIGTGDFNGDGTSDIIWRNDYGGSVLWLMSGTAAIGSAVIGSDPNWEIIGSGDHNGDGHADIIWRHSGGTAILWRMNGLAPMSAVGLGNDPNWAIVAAGDFNGDGRADLVWRHLSGITIAWLMGDGGPKAAAGLGNDPNWLVSGSGDYDGNGRADLLWRHVSGTLVVWLMNGLAPASASAIGTDTALAVVN